MVLNPLMSQNCQFTQHYRFTTLLAKYLAELRSDVCIMLAETLQQCQVSHNINSAGVTHGTR